MPPKNQKHFHSLRRFGEWMSEKNPFGDEEERIPWSVRLLKGSQTPPVDPRMSLDFSDIGRRGSYFFLCDSSHYLKRHVETLQIQSATFARRRLTVDVQLPSDEGLGRRLDGGAYEYWLPVTSLTKRPRSNIDLRDDRGRVIPLLTRNENNEISIAAVLAGAEELLDKPPSALLKALLTETVKWDRMKGEVPLVLAKEALESEGVAFSSESAMAFAETLRILSGNYAMWVRFWGRPGDRRVVKFHYDIELDRQRVLRQRPRTRRYLVFGKQSEVMYPLELEERGDSNPYSPIRRVAARVASSTGLGAVNVGIESPYIMGSDTYHLQVESPPGVETRDIDLLASLEGDADANSWKRDHGAHLYVSHARFAQEGVGLALLTLRIGRRGFMTLSWLSVLLGATILWLFDLTAKGEFESREATAAVLLFGPALLAAMVVRPGEHPVATKLFSGVRLLVALNGILVVAAAAAVAGVRPEGWSAEHCWFVYSIAASVGAAAVSLSWVFSWDITYKAVKGLRRQLSEGKTYRRLCAWVLGLTAALLLVATSLGLELPPPVFLVPMPALAVACGFVSAGYAGLPRSSALLAATAATFTLLVVLAASAILVLQLTSGWAWEEWWRMLAVVPVIGLVLLFLNDRRWHRKNAAPPPSPGSWRSRAEELRAGLPAPRAPSIAWLGQTPTGARLREQAQKNATGVPDLVAPSAYREVEPSIGLVDEGRKMYVEFSKAWTENGPRRRQGDRELAEREANRRARELGRHELVCLDDL